MFSAIVPTCNRNELLQETVDSILQQTMAPDEVIIVNNGDEPVELKGSLPASIKVVDILPYAGVAQARNFGASLARGEYLAFCDDDDLWSASYLETVSAAIEAGAECVISRLDQLVSGRILPSKNAYDKLTVDNLLTLNPGVTGSNIVLSKTLFFEIGGYDPKLPPSEDKALVLEVLLAGVKVATLPHNQVIQRQHEHVRLTHAGKLAEGRYQFTRKYSHLMNTGQLLKNWYKIFYFRRKAGRRTAVLPSMLLYLALLPSRAMDRMNRKAATVSP